ncbi:cupin domain-containing protein [Streptomyces sp. NPDC050509]|uniref:cupin domain-containing protein n=1 Tax=Streptomyces sp. NPDC050509 TaxID=3365620 RepID=UPI00378B9ABE
MAQRHDRGDPAQGDRGRVGAIGLKYHPTQGKTPGARTAWHSHGLGQTLYIVEGVALVQSRGGDIIEAHPSDVIHTPPGGQHWHGAAPDQFMTHLARWETDDATWLEHVSDDEYNGPRADARTRSWHHATPDTT